MSLLCLRDVTHGFDGLPVLAGIDLSLEGGETVALLGPSGCGKTTLLRLAAGLLSPDSGQITCTPRISMAFQESRLLPWRDCLDNVLLGLARRLVPGDREYARNLLAELGLDGFERYPSYALSGGMAHRASLARALVSRPELILLDEPLTGMDFFGRTDLQDRLVRLWHEEKPGVLLVTHDPDEAVFLADRILIFSSRPGRMIAQIRNDAGRPRVRTGKTFLAARAAILAVLANTAAERERN